MLSTASDETYRVVKNDEEQYSIWPADGNHPAGWHATGYEGTKDACLAHIDEVWTDMRPRGLRQALADAKATPPVPAASPAPPVPSLVSRLCAGEQPVEVVLRPEPSLDRFRRALDGKYLHLRFTETIGGTEVGVALSLPDSIDLSQADLSAGTGTVRLAGELVLDFEPLRCEARIDLASLTGQGLLLKS